MIRSRNPRSGKRREWFSLRDVLDIVFRRKKTILFIFAALVLVCAVNVFVNPPDYRSAARVLVRSSGTDVGGPGSSAARAEEVQSEMAILRSREIVERVVEEIGAEWFVSETSRWSGLVQSVDNFVLDRPVSPQERIVRFVKNGLTVERMPRSGVLEVSFRAKSPRLAREVVARVVAEHRNMSIAAHRRTLREPTADGGDVEKPVSLLYRDLVAARRRELAEARQAVRRFQESNTVGAPSEQRAAWFRREAVLQGEVDRLQGKIARAGEAIASMRAGLATPSARAALLAGVAPNEKIRRMEKGLLKLEAKRARLSTLYTKKSRPMRDIDARVKGLRNMVRTERSLIVKDRLRRREASRDGLARQAARIESRRKEHHASLSSLAGGESRLNELNGLVEERKALLDYAVKKLNENVVDDVRAARNVSNLAVVQPTSLPTEPTSMRPSLFLFLGVLASAAASVAAAFVAELFDHSLRSERDVARRLDLPVLGQVPEGEDLLRALEAPTEPTRTYAKIAAGLTRPSDRPAQLIQVASAVHGEGASTAAIQIAQALAARGDRRVLLVDANLRTPALHNLVGVEPEVADLSPLDQTLEISGADVRPFGARNLFVLTGAGDRLGFEPRALFSSKAFEQFLAEARERFDHVIFDSAPVTPYTDAAALAASVDRTILIVRSGGSRYEVTRSAADTLSAVGRRPEGIVLNRLPRAIPEPLYSRL